MRYEHYKRVVQWELIQRFPERTNRNQVPQVEKVTRMWSLIGVGFQPKRIPAAWTALELITGQEPRRVYTKKSVAQRRLKEGDPIGCRVTVTGKAAYDRREQWRRRIFPEVRPFSGFGVRDKSAKPNTLRTRSSRNLGNLTNLTNLTKTSSTGERMERKERASEGVVDKQGNLTFHMEQPGVIPARGPYYEAYFQLVVGSSGNQVGGRYRSVETTGKTKEEGRALMEGRRFPITRKQES